MAKDTSKLTREQQKELARLKFTREGKTFVEISDEIGVSRQTLSKWAKDGRWEEFRTAISLTNEERLRSAYQQLTEFDRMIEARPEGQRFPADNREYTQDARQRHTRPTDRSGRAGHRQRLQWLHLVAA